MTKHEDKIKTLAASALGGPRFQAFIRRYEINIEPPPKEEEKPAEKCVAWLFPKNFITDLRFRIVPNGGARWGQGRLLETEEEDYFNGDDDDDEIIPVPTAAQVFPRGNANTIKRKRPRGSSLTSTSQRPPKSSLVGGVPAQRPAPVATPPLGGLVDYEDDDLSAVAPVESTSPQGSMPPGLLPGSPGVPPSPRLARRQILPSKPPATTTSSPPVPPPPEEAEDALLETLFTKRVPPSPSPSPSLIPREPEAAPAPVLKRRREEDDDELLALANKSKRQSIGPGPGAAKGKESGKGAGAAIEVGKSLAKAAEEGPKKIKLKLASSAAATPAPSSTGAKDGDTG